MIRNYFYLIAGILAIIFSITHAWNGQAVVLPSLYADAMTTDTKTVLFYVWHIITAENFLFGVALLYMSFRKDLTKVRFTAWVLVMLMIARWIVIFVGTLFFNSEGIKNILIDSIAMVIFVSLILLGIKVKDNLRGN